VKYRFKTLFFWAILLEIQDLSWFIGANYLTYKLSKGVSFLFGNSPFYGYKMRFNLTVKLFRGFDAIIEPTLQD
jgi:hypothetical protein